MRQATVKRLVAQLLPPATKLGQGYIFTGVCDSVHGGACVLSGGVHASQGGMRASGGMPGGHVCLGGHAWRGGVHGWGCVWLGGVHGQGACVAGGCALLGACITGGCIAGRCACHACPRPDTMIYGRSMSGLSASYWNAFLLSINSSPFNCHSYFPLPY